MILCIILFTKEFILKINVTMEDNNINSNSNSNSKLCDVKD